MAEKAIVHEVNTYNELIPPAGGLGVTLLIEYDDPEERAVRLTELLGIENHVKLLVDELPPVAGQFDTRQMNEAKVSSVQYIQFPLEAAHRSSWSELGSAGKVRIVVDHPGYSHQAVLPPDTISALAGDLAT